MKLTVTSQQPCSIEKTLTQDGDITLVQLRITYPAPCVPQPVRLSWREPMQDIAATWDPTCDRQHKLMQWFRPTQVRSQLYFGIPLLATLRYDGTNHTVVALSDTVKSSTLAFCVEDFEQNDEVRFDVTLLADEQEQLSSYSATVRIDRRRSPFAAAVRSAAAWLRSCAGIEKHVPAAAQRPLYSTWYNFHQDPTEALLRRELEQAAQLGFGTVIIDDGWQFAGRGTGDYRQCGDWVVCTEKFPDFAGFVRTVHGWGMKVMLWFPVPFVGFETADYQRFKDKLLYNDEVQRAGIYDVRYACVRRHIIDTLAGFARRYGLDGLKLDFVDSFKLLPESPAWNEAMDCATVEEAVLRLLSELRQTVLALDPEFLIEFRQYYVGTQIVSCCNMLRVMDCAYDSLTNRLGIIDSRLAHEDTAIHADMLLWSPEERPENCARQLVDILFGVPQLSLLLTKLPEEQLAPVGAFLRYWNENSDLLLHGDFAAFDPSVNYSHACVTGESKRITVLYTQSIHRCCGLTEDIFNNTRSEDIVLQNPEKRRLTVTLCDICFAPIRQITTSDPLIPLNLPPATHCTVTY